MRNILLILLLFSSGISYSQNNWFWQNPYPTGSHINDSYFVDENIGYAVGNDGTIIKTTNGGKDWSQQISGHNNFLTSVYFLNRDTGFITSGDGSFSATGLLLKTTNGGDNWQPVSSFGNTFLGSITFIDDNTGFLVGGKYWSGGYIFKTTDGGSSWSQYPTLQTHFMNSVYFINENTGFVAGEDGNILKTTNCGTNWYFTNTGTVHFHSIHFPSNDTGYAVGKTGRIFKTIDGGENWSQQKMITTQDLWEVNFIDNNTGYIAAGGSWTSVSGKILKTTNGGISWDSLSISNYNNFRTISIIDSSKIIAMGFWGTIIKTDNSGIDWNNISKSITHQDLDFKKMIFADMNTGYLIAKSGLFFKTTNSGLSWFDISPGIPGSYMDITFNDNFLYSVADGGIAIKSTNNGQNWTNISTGSSNHLRSLNFINNSTGFMAGYATFGQLGQYISGKIFKTTDSGDSWTTMLSVEHHFYSCFFINENTGFASGGPPRSTANTSVYRTTNGGLNWHSSFLPSQFAINDINFVNDTIGFLGGRVSAQHSSYALFKTTDCGITWNSINIDVPYDFHINEIYFLNPSYGYLTSVSFSDHGGGDLFRTTNGGNNWQRFSSIASYPTVLNRSLNSTVFLDDNTGFTIGTKGTIVRTTNGGNTVGIVSINHQIPEKFSLQQNYPNPFNPTTSIRFNLPTKSFVKLTIYNSLGQKVSQLINEQLEIGSYDYEFESNGIPSGIYFYKLETDTFSETKKMVLIK